MTEPRTRRAATGQLGEHIASVFLARHGVVILGRNIEMSEGEIDLLGWIDGQLVLFEVRTTTRWSHPDDLFPQQKRRKLRMLARLTRCRRIDLVWVWIRRRGVRIRWIPQLN